MLTQKSSKSLRLAIIAAFVPAFLAPVAAYADNPVQYVFGDESAAIVSAELADENRGR